MNANPWIARIEEREAKRSDLSRYVELLARVSLSPVYSPWAQQYAARIVDAYHRHNVEGHRP